MTTDRPRVAILFPADAEHKLATRLEQSRFTHVADALGAVGIDVVGAPYADEVAEVVRDQLLGVDGVLAWVNPIEAGHDRTGLNAMLRDVASKGVVVSSHPDVIERMGTKEVLYRTRSMSWGCDTRHYTTAEEMQTKLPMSLASGTPRVLKRMRGHSGDGIWKVELAAPKGSKSSQPAALRVRHAKRGSAEEHISLEAFLELCRPYFAAGQGMIDQAYQSRLPEGMVRCYVVGAVVQGFGEQHVVALHPEEQPDPRHYFPPDRPDFQALKAKLEREWIGELCRMVGMQRSELPVLWDADFLYGDKDAAGADTFVLCEINVSSVYPFPPSALRPLAEETLARIKRGRRP